MAGKFGECVELFFSVCGNSVVFLVNYGQGFGLKDLLSLDYEF